MNLSLTLRIASGFSLVLLLMGLLSWTTYQQQQTNLEKLEKLVSQDVEKLRLSARIVQNLITLQREEKNLILSTSQDDMDIFESALRSAEAELQQRYYQLEKLAGSQERISLESFYKNYQQLLSIQQKIINYTRENSNTRARQLSQNEARQLFDQALPHMESFAGIYAKRADQFENQVYLSLDQIRDRQTQSTDTQAIIDKLETLGRRQRVTDSQIKLATEITRHFVTLQRAEKNIILTLNDKEMQDYAADAEEVIQLIDRKLDQIESQIVSASETDQVLLEHLKSFRNFYSRYQQVYREVIRLSGINANKMAFELSSGPSRELSSKVQNTLAALVDDIDKQLDQKVELRRQQQQIANRNMLITGLAALLVTLLIAGSIVRYQKRRIASLSTKAGKIAVGYLPDREETVTDELTPVDKALDDITENLREVIRLSGNYSNGDFRKRLQPRSQHDSLVDTINQMADSSLEVIRQTKVIASGDYQSDLSPRSDDDELGFALQQMTVNLRRFELDNKNRAWIDNGLTLVSQTALAADDETSLAESLITALSQYTGAVLGVFYTRQDHQTSQASENTPSLIRMAGYAITDDPSLRSEPQWGEGLVGQAAANGRPIEINDIPEDYFRIHSGLGNMLPHHLLLIPFAYQGKVLGVIELALLNSFDENTKTLLERSMDAIGIAVESARRKTELTNALQNAQSLTEELQQQQEELEESNQQLEEQTTQLEKQAEEIEASRNEVEARNEQLQSAQTELTQRAKELELSSKYKSEFLANMSHELRTPLNSIMLLSSMLADGSVKDIGEEPRNQCRIIKEAGTDLLRLINEVLDLAKIESGKISISLKTLPVSNLVKPLQDIFQPLADKKGLSLDFQLDTKQNQAIKTDPDRVLQVLRNFLSNALKFTHEGGIKVLIHVPPASLANDLIEHGETAEHFSANPGDFIAISIKDSGIGIPADKQQLVFEAFQQSDGSISREYGGTGLGLSISRELAGKLGGAIALSSETGKGSTFTLLLPLNGTQTAADESVSSTMPSAEVVIAASKIEAIAKIGDDRDHLEAGDENILLIVEDDMHFAESLMQLAREKGHKVIHTTTGSDAIHLAEHYQPIGILLDIKLPVMDGWQVLQQLKRRESTRHIPVHVMSVTEDNSFSLRLGAIEHLVKPVSSEQIEQALEEIKILSTTTQRKLLIIEDDRVQAEAMARLLCDNDVECTIADTAARAIELLRQQKFHACIVDLKLPDMSGQELIKLISNDNSIPPLPILIYTGRELSLQEEQELREFADSIILKTVDSTERLLEETTIFLHRVTSRMSEDKKHILRQLGGTEKVLAGRTVLVVDDDIRNTFALKAMLENKGINVISAINGEKGIEALKNNPAIDIVLMDIMMPVMDGLTAMREIRKIKDYAELPIIALTAKAMSGDRQECLAAGASDYMSKPLDYSQLLSLLRVWLSTNR
jgi:CheY-like chemotaxis protein/signal transduction histidine kinase